jgi:hypothetical protein
MQNHWSSDEQDRELHVCPPLASSQETHYVSCTLKKLLARHLLYRKLHLKLDNIGTQLNQVLTATDKCSIRE